MTPPKRHMANLIAALDADPDVASWTAHPDLTVTVVLLDGTSKRSSADEAITDALRRLGVA